MRLENIVFSFIITLKPAKLLSREIYAKTLTIALTLSVEAIPF